MAYCIGKSIEMQRGNAAKGVILEHRIVAQVAKQYDKCRTCSSGRIWSQVQNGSMRQWSRVWRSF